MDPLQYQNLESEESLVHCIRSGKNSSAKDLIPASRVPMSQIRSLAPGSPISATVPLNSSNPIRDPSLLRSSVRSLRRADSLRTKSFSELKQPSTGGHSRDFTDGSNGTFYSQGLIWRSRDDSVSRPWAAQTPASSVLSIRSCNSRSEYEGEDANILVEGPKPLFEPIINAKRDCMGRLKDDIHSQFDLKAVFHLIDFRPWFYPFTWKKYIVLTLLACTIGGIVISDLRFRWIEKSMKITRSYMLPVLIISVCAEPLIVFLILPIARMPDIPAYERVLNLGKRNAESDVEAAASSVEKRNPKAPFETALIIPCHNTDHVAMKTTIDSALPHFRPEDIFIIDNGGSKHPSHPAGNFREYIRSLHPDIVYIWSPIGSKNAAQLVGALAARNRGYKYIMTVDDDVCIPPNFTAPTDMIDDTFKAVAYPLKAMDADCNVPLFLVAWQDVEYRLSGLSKLCEDRLCGVQFPHGAGWFVELDTFIELMEFYHPMDFIAEDCNAGLGLCKMNKGIRLDARSFLATEVPTSFFGPGLSWWKQRQKSWEMGRHGRIFAFIRAFLFSSPPKKTIQGILWHKFTFLYLICTIIMDWLRIPVIVSLGRTLPWWRNALLLILFAALPPMAYNYWKCRRRRDMQIRFWAALTYPIYKQLYVLVAIFGAIRWAGYFLGGHVAPPTIQQMKKNNDERCFWLDPRFKENPAWLADEGEAVAAKEMVKETALEKPIITEGAEMFVLKPNTSLELPRATYDSPLHPASARFPGPQTESWNSPRPRLSPDLSAATFNQFVGPKPLSPLWMKRKIFGTCRIFRPVPPAPEPQLQTPQDSHSLRPADRYTNSGNSRPSRPKFESGSTLVTSPPPSITTSPSHANPKTAAGTLFEPNLALEFELATSRPTMSRGASSGTLIDLNPFTSTNAETREGLNAEARCRVANHEAGRSVV